MWSLAHPGWRRLYCRRLALFSQVAPDAESKGAGNPAIAFVNLKNIPNGAASRFVIEAFIWDYHGFEYLANPELDRFLGWPSGRFADTCLALRG